MARAAKKTETQAPKADKRYLPIDALIEEVNKTFGVNTIVRASEAVGLVKPRFSTGSFALDLVLNGGSPEGAIELICGERTTAKSWSLLSRIREFLTLHPEAIAVIVDAEQTNDPDFLRMLRVPLERVYIVRPDSGEQAWDAAIFIAQKAEKVYLGVDSLDALVPMAELSCDMDEAKMALAARMNNRGFRKLITQMRSDLLSEDQRVTACFVCQLRDSIGIMFGPTSRTVGGKGKDFAAAQILRLSRKRYMQSEGEKLLDKVTYGMEIEAKIEKSKGWGEGEAVIFRLYKENYGGFRRGEIDNFTDMIPFLLKYNIISKAGAWYTVENQRVQGEAALSEILRGDPELFEVCRKKVIEAVRQRHDHLEAPSGAVSKPPKTFRRPTTKKITPTSLKRLGKK